MKADELTVADGSATGTTATTNRYAPVYGYYCDGIIDRAQMIYPKSMISGLVGNTITDITFYSTTATQSWGTARFTIRIAEVAETTLSAINTTASFTVVGTNRDLSIALGKITIHLDGEGYTYSGANDKNLLIDIEMTAKGTGSSSTAPVYNGITATSGTSYTQYKYSSYSSVSNASNTFLPKATFTYEDNSAACKKPKNIQFTDLKSTSVAFSWDKGGEETAWQYLCLPAATTIEDSHWESALSASGQSASISGLTASSSYIFYLRSDCSSDGYSKVSQKAFKTPCDGETLPWSCGFEASEGYSNSTWSSTSAAPACWDMLNANSGYPYIQVYSRYKHDGTQSLDFTSGKDKSCYIALPAFASPTNVLKISFWYRNEETTDSNGQLSVGYMTDVTDETTYVEVSSCTRTTTVTQKQNILFTGAPSFARIVFRYSGTKDDYYAAVDDILVESTQDCSKPATPTYSDLTGSSVTINWTANAGVDDYKYINVDRTATPDYVLDWENDATPISATSVDLDELTDGHNYEFYVMCACGTEASDACEYQPLSCPNVTGVTLSNQVWDGVTVNWTTSATTNCDVQYKAGSGEWTAAATNLDATSKTITGLSVGTEYSFRVKPNCSADGWVAPASTYEPACPALGDLTLSNEKYNGVTVSWSAATGISTWTLKYRKGSDDWTVVEDIDEETYTISSGLVTNEEYTIELYSECGGDAASTTYTPVYAAPTSVLVSAQDLGGDASWAPVEGATGYQYIVVLKDAAQDWSTPATGTTVSSGYVHANPVLSGLHAKTAYDFYVKAVFAGGTSVATKKSFTTTSHAPNTPTVADGDITSSSAIATWTLPAACQATQCQWICKLTSAGTPAVDDAAWSTPSTEFTANISGLEAYTDYTVYVRAYYEDGIYSANTSKGFKTKCGTETLPFSYDFGSSYPSTLSACWNTTYTGSYNWGLDYNWSSAEGYNYYIKFQARASSSYYAILETPSIELSTEAILTFKWKNDYNIATELLISTDGGSTKSSIDAEVDADLSTTTGWANKSVDLSAYVGETVILYFKGTGKSTSGKYISLDDINIAAKPCDAPTFAAANIEVANASATISCAESKWNLRYRTNGVGDWTTISNITAASRTITGLTNGTTYEAQIQNVCSATRSSSWTSSQTFTPVNCPVPTSLEATQITHNSATISWSGDAKALRYKKGSDDWSSETISPAAESFDLSELVAESTYTVQVKADCEDGDNWSAELEFATKCAPITVTKVAPFEADFAGLTNEMPSCWEKSETTYPYVTSGELKFYANEANQTAILPAFSNNIATLVLKFSYKNYSSMSGYGKLQIGYIDNNGDFQAVGSTLTNKGSYFATEVNFDGVTGAKNIAIRFLDNANAEAYSYVKDVVVELAPTCYAPASIADATSITSEGATLSWTASGKGETQYQWAVAEGSAAPVWVDDAAHKVGTTSKAVSGLNANSDYTFYVRSYCAADDQSEAVSKAFTTKCAAIAAAEMPFEEAFSATLGACWKTYAASYYSIYVSSGELHATAPKSSGNESVLVLPAFEMPLNQLVVSFDYKGSNGTVEVGYVTDPEDKTTFVAVGDAYTVASAYKQAVTAFVSLGAVTGNVALRFKGVGIDGSFTVDNLRVAYGTGIADNTDNSEALAGMVGQTVDFVVNRTFVRNFESEPYFNTICLPFSLSAEELAAGPLAGAELWTFKYASVVNDELQVRIQQESSLKAGRPYLILFEAGDNLVNPLFKNVTISAASGEHMSFENIAFIGTLAPVAFTADDQYRLFLAANNQLAWANANGNVRSFRAYFQITPPSSPSPIRRGMKARIVQKEEVTTGMDEVGQNSNVESQKLIENNQVIIIRNGVKYNLQGQAIK